jgi:hypothetical protein
MPEDKRRSDFEDLGFPFQEYLDESESPDDFPAKEIEDQDIPKILVGTFGERLSILKEAIEEIDCEIGIRKELSKSFHGALKESRDWLTKKLRKFEDWEFGYKPSVDFRRTTLERELLGIYRESRAEQQKTFSDIVGLKKDRRKLLMEYKSLKATGKMVANR